MLLSVQVSWKTLFPGIYAFLGVGFIYLLRFFSNTSNSPWATIMCAGIVGGDQKPPGLGEMRVHPWHPAESGHSPLAHPKKTHQGSTELLSLSNQWEEKIVGVRNWEKVVGVWLLFRCWQVSLRGEIGNGGTDSWEGERVERRGRNQKVRECALSAKGTLQC